MGDEAGFDLDRDTAAAWVRFQARLADRLAEMGDDDILVVEPEVSDDELDGASPYVQFAGFGDGRALRGEVSSNSYLDAAFELDDEAVATLTGLGWGAPTADTGEETGEGSANFFVDLPVSGADRLAVMAVRALRDVFGVPHPAFLHADGLELDPDALGASREESPEAEEPLTVTPRDADHLRELVDRALAPMFGSTPEHDDDGDIPVPYGSSLVWVHVDDDNPVVDLFSVVVDGVADVDRAALEVGILNRDLRFMKFVLVEDRIMARVHVPAWPFVPEHLRSMLTGMSAHLDDLDEDLVARVGGRRAIEASDEDDDGPDDDDVDDVDVLEDEDDDGDVETARQAASDHLALTTLLQLDVEASGAVDVELAAGICGFDQARLVRLLEQTERQEISWATARDRAREEGDAEEASACEHERAAWERTAALLRRGLRLVVERALGRGTPPVSRSADDHTDPSERSVRRAARRHRFRPRPDHGPVVEELEDLLRGFGVGDVAELDQELTELASMPVDVLDLDDQVQVRVAGDVAGLPYPFTLADFRSRLRELTEAARSPLSAEGDG